MEEIQTTTNLPTNITASNTSFGEGFNNLREAIKFAEIISKTDFAPPNMKNKPCDILVAIQMGAEIGLKPMQSIFLFAKQNIAVINGKPSIGGDAALALVKNHKDYEYCTEYWENENTPNITAVCEIKRKNESLKIVKFSLKDAEQAGLLTNNTSSFSAWKKYPKRMLQMRARGFALRDSFPDALHGLITKEEAQDYNYKENNGERFNETKIYIPKDSEKEHESLTCPAESIDIPITPMYEEIKATGYSLKEEEPKNSQDQIKGKSELIDKKFVPDSITDDVNREEELFEEDRRERHSQALFEIERMITEKHIDNASVYNWLKKGKVKMLSELKTETLEAIIKNISKKILHEGERQR